MNQSSHVLAEEPHVDLAVTEALVEELETYIIKDDLYRTVIANTPVGDQKISMTGGDLLARLHRLQSERDALSADEQSRLDAVVKQAESVIYSLKTRFHQRLEREMKTRLDSLKWFLDDCLEDRQRCRANFPYEMRNRQRIEEILKRLGDDVPSELIDRLKEVDRRIRQNASASAFIWDPRFESIYPRDRYWFLYMRP